MKYWASTICIRYLNLYLFVRSIEESAPIHLDNEKWYDSITCNIVSLYNFNKFVDGLRLHLSPTYILA